MFDDQNLKYLALGDSYTIGTCVLPEERFPLQLKSMLENKEWSKSKQISLLNEDGQLQTF